ncbi:MAG: CDGSH iron-sulfur domain-containing protein [Rikenellaceae bacterium]
MTKKTSIQEGSFRAPEKFHITISHDGPYLIFGSPKLSIQSIETNKEGECWNFKEGATFNTEHQPTALCRCGASKKKPYCDGSHIKTEWSPELTAPNKPLLEDAEFIEGAVISLSDNESYCAFSRFCDAEGRTWNLVENEDENSCDIAIREANTCPSGRLSAWDKSLKEPQEPSLEPSLALIEDPSIGVSGPLWVRGGIPIAKEDGEEYEIRNRITLCRCGQSANKPFCDGTHATIRFEDHLY